MASFSATNSTVPATETIENCPKQSSEYATESAEKPEHFMTFSTIQKQDYPYVQRIFQQGIDGGNSTFEIAPAPSFETWMEGKYPTCCLIARNEQLETLGWASLASTSKRTVFVGVAELSVYIANEHQGKRVATRLLHQLFQAAELANIWTIQSGIFPENTISLQVDCGLCCGYVMLMFFSLLSLLLRLTLLMPSNDSYCIPHTRCMKSLDFEWLDVVNELARCYAVHIVVYGEISY